MHDSPRIRRLRNDLTALERLATESSVFEFKASGIPPSAYSITFNGKGLARDRGKIRLVHSHQVEIKLGTSYPRTIPEIRWITPIYHPNISEIGMVCLGGYGTHWVPSVQLDELCMMLWDMARYHNYDIRSPYNRDAALWVANQTSIAFPVDGRPLRDLRAAQGRVETVDGDQARPDRASESSGRSARKTSASSGGPDRSPMARVRKFIERYGRAFEPESSSPNGTMPQSANDGATLIEPAPIVPRSFVSGGVLEREPVQTAPSFRPQETAAGDRDDGFVFLEEQVSPPVGSAPTAPLGEDIHFIE